MLSKSRLIVAVGLVLALAVSGIAFAQGTVNEAFVDGSVKPSKKLDKKKYKKTNLFLGIRNQNTVTGAQINPAAEKISISKNVKVDLNKADRCPVTLSNGTPTSAAKAQCPPGSLIGTGEAEVQAPGNVVVATPEVNVFNGPGNNQLQLHTYSDQLGAASPVVPASIVNSDQGSKFKHMLNVPVAPETGALLITKFNATLAKSSGVPSVKCKPKTVTFLREVTYKDGTSETAELKQPVKCKPKKN